MMVSARGGAPPVPGLAGRPCAPRRAYRAGAGGRMKGRWLVMNQSTRVRTVVTLLLLIPLLLVRPGRPAAAQEADPFAYCAAVGTVDRPDHRWTGPPVPDAVIEGLIRAAGLPEDAPRDPLRRSTFWRCMGGHVYACFVGANLPCQEKADTRRIPRAAMWRFCRANPGADSIPAVVTGRATVYQWRCTGSRPTIVRQVDAPDARGFLKRIWYRISPK
ncbi:hypothetical protein STH551 [Symbiobacterium thermophilum IAM 14863]|uniref:Uncharacterized protein n=2 Tax=Symbiobacterium thermophilum TaxID=2734 RepID=Q67S07_SYMTH|nr:hypothetical protein STH551 [Symbiobacterium thermophilum IAM 14863]